MISIGWIYLVLTLIWGSTWIVILGQFGVVAPEVSVFYRFVVASFFAFLFCWFKKTPLRFSKSDHFWFAVQGICNFSINYMLTYHAEELVTTGLVAVAFSALPYYNAIGMFLFFRKKPDLRTVSAMLLGGVGLLLIFQNELKFDPKSISGILFALAGTFFASLGNLTGMRHLDRKLPVFASLTWAMFYGAVFSGLYCLVLQKEFVWDLSLKFNASLLYLAIPGTVVAFGFYFHLISKVGAAKAAYTSIMIPILALLLSYFFESFQWTNQVTVGLLLAIAGQFLILKKSKQK